MPRPSSLPKAVRYCLAYATLLAMLALALIADSFASLAAQAGLTGLILLTIACLILLALWLRLIYLRWSQQNLAHTSSWFWLN